GKLSDQPRIQPRTNNNIDKRERKSNDDDDIEARKRNKATNDIFDEEWEKDEVFQLFWSGEGEQQREVQTESDEEREEENYIVVSLWYDWSKFVDSFVNKDPLNIYKPELYGVLWCGKGVSKREDIPFNLFCGIQEQVKTKFRP
ncbi:hypothetical protein BDC45DRAFT_602809, partial [Circinella umbellata]